MKTGKPAKGISDVVDQVVRDLMSTRCEAALGAPYTRADTKLGTSQVGPVADKVGLVPPQKE